jgi:hypothetical protein
LPVISIVGARGVMAAAIVGDGGDRHHRSRCAAGGARRAIRQRTTDDDEATRNRSRAADTRWQRHDLESVGTTHGTRSGIDQSRELGLA